MQTQSEEKRNLPPGTQSRESIARNEKPRRSIFSNFQSGVAGAEQPCLDALRSDKAGPNAGDSRSIQTSIDHAIARSFLYQFLARAFEDQTRETWSWLTSAETGAAFQSAASFLPEASTQLNASASAFVTRLSSGALESFQSACVTAFGHAARGDCPLNEIEYGDLKADPLFQPHRLADLSAFYRAFGLQVADGAAERPDHLGMELEFMAVLTAKEAYALEFQMDADQLTICRDTQKKFLREHLGRWVPAFARRLARAATDEMLAGLAVVLRDFIVAECARFGLHAGSEDLLLRPVDETAESLCASCGIAPFGPGSVGATTGSGATQPIQ